MIIITINLILKLTDMISQVIGCMVVVRSSTTQDGNRGSTVVSYIMSIAYRLLNSNFDRGKGA